MSFVSTYSGAPTPLPTEGGAAKRFPQPRVMSRGRTNMSQQKKVGFSRKPIDFSTNDLGSRVCEFLSRIHPDKTAAHVSHDTGIPVASIAYWLATGGRPSAAHLLALIGAYEAEFLISVAPSLGKWLDPVLRERKLSELQSKRNIIDEEIRSLKDSDNVERTLGHDSTTDGGGIGLSDVSVRGRGNSLSEGSASPRNSGEAATAEET